MTQSLQERYAPDNACFGCGPANAHGFRIRSVPAGDDVVLDWVPEARHEAIHGFLNGGVIATLFDCHMAWTAAWDMRTSDARLPLAVTAEITVTYLSPTTSDGPVQIRARTTDATDRKATVEAELYSDGQVRATSHGIFVRAGETMRA